MPTEILAVGTSEIASGDVTIAAGDSLTVALKDATGPVVASGCIVDIQLKDDDGQYYTIDTLSVHKPAVVISAAGTYRFDRKNRAGASCGVFSG
jgi:hypothetical protein